MGRHGHMGWAALHANFEEILMHYWLSNLATSKYIKVYLQTYEQVYLISPEDDGDAKPAVIEHSAFLQSANSALMGKRKANIECVLSWQAAT